jgi:hypothetical protein
MPSNHKQRDLKSASVVVASTSNSEFLSGGTYIKRDKPGNVQSKAMQRMQRHLFICSDRIIPSKERSM